MIDERSAPASALPFAKSSEITNAAVRSCIIDFNDYLYSTIIAYSNLPGDPSKPQ